MAIRKVGNHADRLFEGLGESLNGSSCTCSLAGLAQAYLTFSIIVVMSHFDKVVHLPDGFNTIATTKNSEFAGIAHETLPIFGMSISSRPTVKLADKHV